LLQAVATGRQTQPANPEQWDWLLGTLGGAHAITTGASQAYTALADYLNRIPDERKGLMAALRHDRARPAFFSSPLVETQLAVLAPRGRAAAAAVAHPSEHVLSAEVRAIRVAPRPAVSFSTEEAATITKGDATELAAWIAEHCIVDVSVRLLVASPPERHADPQRLRSLERCLPFDHPIESTNAARLVLHVNQGGLMEAGAWLHRKWFGSDDAADFRPSIHAIIDRGLVPDTFLTDTPSVTKTLKLELQPSGSWAIAGLRPGGPVISNRVH